MLYLRNFSAMPDQELRRFLRLLEYSLNIKAIYDSPKELFLQNYCNNHLINVVGK